MTYKPVKNIIFALIFGLSLTGKVFAQSNAQMMNELMVNAMMQYGQKLYDRGDMDEATAVFNHVLTYDDHQPQALSYLKEMGRLPLPEISVPDALGSRDILTDADLKAAIEAKKLSIEKLKSQIGRLRANLAAQAAQE